MIVWCQKCGTAPITVKDETMLPPTVCRPMCFDCSKWELNTYAFRAPVDEMLLYPYHATEYFAPQPDPYERVLKRMERDFWDAVMFGPRKEYNTVDLAELRREREWQKRQIRYKEVFSSQ